MSIDGTILFDDNSAVQADGGALYSTSFGQIQLFKGSYLNFTKNKGKYDTLMFYCLVIASLVIIYSYGAAIVAETQRVPSIFQRLPHNPLCFLLYEEERVVPNEWSEVSAINYQHYINFQ